MRMRTLLMALLLLAGIVPAAAKHIPCVLVNGAIRWTGSEDAAKALAASRGYTQEQIREAMRRCLGKQS